MPGVVWNNDITNEMMVRGGSPEENLYVVDGIEVPNINHIAVEGTPADSLRCSTPPPSAVLISK